MITFRHQTEDCLSLVEQNFKFLHVGIYLDHYSKTNDMSKFATELGPLTINLLEEHRYKLDNKIAAEQFKCYFSDKKKPSIFDYLIRWNAFRGIFMAMREGLGHNHTSQNKSEFIQFGEKILSDNYQDFYTILCFLRNVLSHNINDEIRLSDNDYSRTFDYLIKKRKNTFPKLYIDYKKILPCFDTEKNYEFNIAVNFETLTPGMRFIDVISEWQLFMFAEFCYNLVLAYRLTIEKSAM